MVIESMNGNILTGSKKITYESSNDNILDW